MLPCRARLRCRRARWTVTLLRVRRRGPLGPRCIQSRLARLSSSSAGAAAAPGGAVRPRRHRRPRAEHSLELQLPFLARLFPDVPILPLLVGHQRAANVAALGEAWRGCCGGASRSWWRAAILSHYQSTDGRAAGCGRPRSRRALRPRRSAGEPRCRLVPRVRRGTDRGGDARRTRTRRDRSARAPLRGFGRRHRRHPARGRVHERGARRVCR